MRFAQIRKMDISNGEGIGVSLFTQGCPDHCAGCHNPSTWSKGGGEEYTQETEDKIVELVQSPHVTRLSILGGEPLIPQNVTQLLFLAKKVKDVRPDLKIWLWTGTTVEAIHDLEHYRRPMDEAIDPTFSALGWNDISITSMSRLLGYYVDYLIDGRFAQEKKDLTLRWCGSSNQRVIDCRKTFNDAAECIHLADV